MASIALENNYFICPISIADDIKLIFLDISAFWLPSAKNSL